MKERFWELAYKAMIGLLVASSVAFVFVISTRALFGWYPVTMTPDSPVGYFDRATGPIAPTAEQQAIADRADEIDRLNAMASEIGAHQPVPLGE